MMATREGLSLAKDLGIRALILEGDAMVVLDSSVDLSHNGLIDLG